jgi:hypothetical protein
MIEYNYPENGIDADTLSHLFATLVPLSSQIIIHTSNSHTGNKRTRHANWYLISRLFPQPGICALRKQQQLAYTHIPPPCLSSHYEKNRQYKDDSLSLPVLGS